MDSPATNNPDDEVQDIMKSYDLDEDVARQVLEVMEEHSIDEESAVELVEEGL